MSKIQVLVWSDNFWCLPDQLEENMIAGRNDDYSIIWVNGNLVDFEINDIVINRAEIIRESLNG